MTTTERLADWHDFLRIRHELIHRWIGEGKTPAYVVDTLAMDPMQVTLIAMTPLGPRQSDPRWSAGTEAPSAEPTPREALGGMPERLSLLADWLDVRFPNDTNPEAQQDLRRWARALTALLAAEEA